MLDSRLFFLLWAEGGEGPGEARSPPPTDGPGLGLGAWTGTFRLGFSGCWSLLLVRARDCDVPTEVVELLAWVWVKTEEGGVALRYVGSKGPDVRGLRPLVRVGC